MVLSGIIGFLKSWITQDYLANDSGDSVPLLTSTLAPQLGVPRTERWIRLLRTSFPVPRRQQSTRRTRSFRPPHPRGRATSKFRLPSWLGPESLLTRPVLISDRYLLGQDSPKHERNRNCTHSPDTLSVTGSTSCRSTTAHCYLPRGFQ